MNELDLTFGGVSERFGDALRCKSIADAVKS